MSEHRRDGDERHAIEVIEGEVLVTETERHLAFADRFTAIGQDRTEASSRPLERSG